MAASTNCAEWVGEAKKNSGWLMALGVVMVLFGMMAIGSPLLTGITVSILVGAVLVAAGVARTVEAFKSQTWGQGLLGLLGGVLTTICGLLFLLKPVFGLKSLTLVLAIYFLLEGVSRSMLALKVRPERGWGAMLFGGIVTVLLGLLIWGQWPLSGAWAMGTLVGIHILLNGWCMIAVGSTARARAEARGEAEESN